MTAPLRFGHRTGKGRLSVARVAASLALLVALAGVIGYARWLVNVGALAGVLWLVLNVPHARDAKTRSNAC